MSKKIEDKSLLALKNEIQMAIAYNQKELQPIIDECLSRYTGNYVPDFASNWDIVVNEIYPVVQNYMPSIFFRTPRAILKPKQKTYIARRRDPVTGKMEDVVLNSQKSAEIQEAVLNYSVTEEMDYKKQVRSVLLNSLVLPFGVLWHGYKGNFGMTEERSYYIKDDSVFVKNIFPTEFIYDPSVSIFNIDEARWVGRVINVPIQDLFEDDKLDIDKKRIKGFTGYGNKVGVAINPLTGMRLNPLKVAADTSRPTTLINFATKDFEKAIESKFVQVYEIFLRPTKKQAREGDNGTILLLTDEQDKPLRISDWTIKAEGFPAKILYFNEVPNAKIPMADIDSYKQIADQKNVIFNLQLRNAQENSKVWVGLAKQGADEEDIEMVRQGQNTIVTFDTEDVRNRMFVSSPGGTASSELYIIDQRIQKNLEDKSGITDLRRGFLQSGEESATSVRIREAGGAVRIAYRQDIMADFLIDSFKYINKLNRQFKSVEDAVRIVGTLDVDWVDNISKEDLQADVDVDINVFSMLPENPERELRSLNTVLALMIQGLTMPEIRQKILEEGNTMNLSPLIEQILLRIKVKHPEIFRRIKPEESMGFVSVQQLQQARQNVQASLTGQQPPFPPQASDDHKAKLEVYTSTMGLLQALGQTSDQLEQLIRIHTLLLQQISEKQSSPGQVVSLKKPTMEVV